MSNPCFGQRSGLRFAVLTIVFLSCAPVHGQSSDTTDLWSDADGDQIKSMPTPDINAQHFRTLSLSLDAMVAHLSAAPPEKQWDLKLAPTDDELILGLPMPDGDFAEFRVVESSIMEADLAAAFPQIKTFRGVSVDDPRTTVRLDHTPAGFHAMVSSPAGRVFIDPYRRGDTESYISYWAHDVNSGTHSLACGVHDTIDNSANLASAQAARGGAAIMLRTYRTAVAATGEYTAFHGGTVELGQAAIVTAMNRVNEIYEQDVAIRMVLVGDNDSIVYTDAATDPYTNDNGSAMLGQNQSNLDTVIGSANYDIGHVFSTGGGGIASLGVPCINGSKARGVTGLGSPIGDPFWVDFVAHEMGHQWAGNHTFNGDDGSCAGGNRNGSTAYEPGSGSTIQAYAGICGSQNLQGNSDPYFHGISLDEIISYSRFGSGNGCAVQTATGNNPPVVDAGPDYTIPLQTPFELCGSATDDDPLTFAWEQFDLGPAGAPDSPVGNAPIFRSFNPEASPCRTFPRLPDLASGEPVIGEILPTYARTMNFRLTARDNLAGGGAVGDDATMVTVSDLAGPFRVTSPNDNVSWAEGSSQDVTWDVADTDLAPVSCPLVDITLSTDGGLTYPTVLAAGVANNGISTVALPAMSIEAARVQVRCSSSIFFDISDQDVSIGVPLVDITSPADASTVSEGDEVTFAGTATDPEDGDLSASLAWVSSIDGSIGSGATFQSTTLSLGTHTITASVTDSDTNSASAEIMLSVEPPCVFLLDSNDFETDNDGWADGNNTCTTGAFIRGTPDQVDAGGVITQPDGASSGSFAWFTANNAGGAGTDDVDGGTCETLSSPLFVGAGSDVTAFVDYFHGQRDTGDDSRDGFQLEILDADTDAVLESMVEIGDVATNAVWTSTWTQFSSASANIRLRVRTTDGTADGDLVEGGVDNIRICLGSAPPDVIFEDTFGGDMPAN
ncbi:MAG: hypothetical protein DHS20C11_37110 [Lysobacteraceae bacterium]|nr:MAG: hypothetical protein DHS20C11_37110 [Xanthomonadaceae bacterium]